MKKILLFLLLCTTLESFSQTEPEPPYKRFPTLPPLKLLLTDSITMFTEKDLKKNQEVLLILFSPDCDHCQKGTEELVANMDKFKNIQIVMATVMLFDKMKAFYINYQLNRFDNIKMGQDKFFLLPAFYRARSIPVTALYDKKGNLIDAFPGSLPVPKVLELFEKK